MVTEHRLAVRDVTLRATVEGPERRAEAGTPAVVALHGGPGVDGDGLRWFLSPLASVLDVVVMDQRGHGRSDIATSATWELDEWADDVAAVIEALALDRPVVFGISFGGWVALRHASRHPGQARALVVAAQTARLLGTQQIAERMGELGGPESKRAWLAHQHPSSDEAEFNARCLSLMSVRRPSAALQAVRKRQVRTQQVNDHFTPQFNTLDLTEDATRVAVPVTLVLGDRDPFATAALAQETLDAAPTSGRLVIVPDAAHDLLIDAPDVLLAEIGRACLGVPRRTA